MSSKEYKKYDEFSGLWLGIFIVLVSLIALIVNLKDIFLLGEIQRVSNVRGGVMSSLNGAGNILLMLVMLGLGVNTLKTASKKVKNFIFIEYLNKISLEGYIKYSAMLVILVSVYGIFQSTIFVESLICLILSGFILLKIDISVKIIWFLGEKMRHYFEKKLKDE